MSLPRLLLLASFGLALGLGCQPANTNPAGDRARNGVTTHTYSGDPDLERGPGGSGSGGGRMF